MIDVVTSKNAHLHRDAIIAQHRFRYRQFVCRSGWDVPHADEMEYDQFDTQGAVYLLSRASGGVVQGMVRLLPTTAPYMTETLWPDLAPPEGLPRNADVWENTRFAVERELPPERRSRIASELILASLEFGLASGIERYLLISPLWILRGVLASSGLPHRLLQETGRLGRRTVASAFVPVSDAVIAQVRHRVGIHGPVARTLPHAPMHSLQTPWRTDAARAA